MKFTVEIPDDIVYWANAEGVNRQMIAKFMRTELQAVGTRYGNTVIQDAGPGRSHDWRGWIFNEARVRAQKRASKDVDSVDAATGGR